MSFQTVQLFSSVENKTRFFEEYPVHTFQYTKSEWGLFFYWGYTALMNKLNLWDVFETTLCQLVLVQVIHSFACK